MGHVDCQTAKDSVRLRLFAKQLSLYKEVAIVCIISFRKGFTGIVKYCIFVRFSLLSDNCLAISLLRCLVLSCFSVYSHLSYFLLTESTSEAVNLVYYYTPWAQFGSRHGSLLRVTST